MYLGRTVPDLQGGCAILLPLPGPQMSTPRPPELQGTAVASATDLSRALTPFSKALISSFKVASLSLASQIYSTG